MTARPQTSHRLGADGEALAERLWDAGLRAETAGQVALWVTLPARVAT